MKKYIFLLLFLPLLIVNNGTAQPKKTGAKHNTVTISVKAVEYDNPAFEDLRKTIKGNIKVAQSNPGFTGDTATITLQYEGTAPELWDELPQNTKQAFKITAINNNRIDLTLKQNSTTAVAAETNKENCIDCYYYKTCDFDTSLVYNGNTYKGFKKRAAAYFCKDGTLYSKSYSKNKAYTQIIFKGNFPVGTNWVDTFGTVIINKTVVAKGSGIMHQKKYYEDAIIVYYSDTSLTALYYYAKGLGFIKMDTLDKAFNPSTAAKMRGVVDTSLTGSWKLYNDINRTSYYYKFNGDGTFAYYNGSISKATQMPEGVSLWRVNDNYIELYNGAWGSISQITYKKKNDPITGLPAIAFGSGNNMVYYVSADGKPAWK